MMVLEGPTFFPQGSRRPQYMFDGTPKWPQEPPRGPQDAPRGPREAQKRPQEAPKRLPRGFKTASTRPPRGLPRDPNEHSRGF